MQTLRLFIPGIILIGAFLLWYKDPKARIVKDFANTPHILDHLKDALLKDSTLQRNLGVSIAYNDLDKKTKVEFEKLGLDDVEHVRIMKADCDEALYYIDLEYYDDGFRFDPCPSEKRISGRHYVDDSSLIEFWELDEHWTYWENIDAIG